MSDVRCQTSVFRLPLRSARTSVSEVRRQTSEIRSQIRRFHRFPVVAAVLCRAVALCVGWSAALRRIHEQKETKKTKIVGLVRTNRSLFSASSLITNHHPLSHLHPDNRPVAPKRCEGGSLITDNRVNASRAFTLIELLVVIIIIAILAGLLFPAFIGTQNQAKKAQAKNDLIQIVTAVNAFYTEYGKYPLATADTIYGPEGTSSADLFYTLRAIALGANAPVNGVPAVNSRAIIFISPPSVKDTTNPRSGIGSDGQYYDPWGTRYNLEIDGDYNNQITNPYPDTDGSAGANPLGFGVIGWSYGSDQAKGTKGTSTNYKNSDDVISWQ